MDQIFLNVQQRYIAELLGQINSLLGVQARMAADLKKADERIKELEKIAKIETLKTKTEK